MLPDWCEWPRPGTPLTVQDVCALRAPHGLIYTSLHAPESRTNVLICEGQNGGYLGSWEYEAGPYATAPAKQFVHYATIDELLAVAPQLGVTIWGLWHFSDGQPTRSHRHYYPVRFAPIDKP